MKHFFDDDKQCYCCEYWVERESMTENDHDEMGKCCRYPPEIFRETVVDTEQDEYWTKTTTVHRLTYFPETHCHEWCGEFSFDPSRCPKCSTWEKCKELDATREKESAE